MGTTTDDGLLTRGTTEAGWSQEDQKESPGRIPLQVSFSVRLVETVDGAAVLDLSQCLCFGMSPVGVTVWRGLADKRTLGEIVDQLSSEHPEVDRNQIWEDVVSFVKSLRAKRLLNASEYKTPPRDELVHKLLKFVQRASINGGAIEQGKAKRQFLFWKALWALAMYDAIRLGNNFVRSYELVRQWHVPAVCPKEQVIERVCRAINYACVWYPKRVRCVQRSVITTCLLRHCGVPAHMVIGARRVPFSAHAWTEVNGNVINERKDIRSYLVWERC